MAACHFGHLHLVRTLLALGADVDALDDSGTDALMHVCTYEQASLQVASCKLQAASCKLQIASCKLQATQVRSYQLQRLPLGSGAAVVTEPRQPQAVTVDPARGEA